jgi:succinate dehydrogenase hydrophobic anchor subunit
MMRDQKLWTWHVAAGLVILVLLGLHMVVMHLESVVKLPSLNPAGGEAVDWKNVAARGQMAFFSVTYVLLLGAALFHGLYGLRNILFELNPRTGLKTAISVTLLLMGLGLFFVGTWAAVTFSPARPL